jgi:hypothetical protein
MQENEEGIDEWEALNAAAGAAGQAADGIDERAHPAMMSPPRRG